MMLPFELPWGSASITVRTPAEGIPSYDTPRHAENGVSLPFERLFDIASWL